MSTVGTFFNRVWSRLSPKATRDIGPDFSSAVRDTRGSPSNSRSGSPTTSGRRSLARYTPHETSAFSEMSVRPVRDDHTPIMTRSRTRARASSASNNHLTTRSPRPSSSEISLRNAIMDAPERNDHLVLVQNQGRSKSRMSIQSEPSIVTSDNHNGNSRPVAGLAQGQRRCRVAIQNESPTPGSDNSNMKMIVPSDHKSTPPPKSKRTEGDCCSRSDDRSCNKLEEDKSGKDLTGEADENDNNPECAVCLLPCIHPVQLPCSHIFCYLCMKGVANQNKKCALCRREISLDFLNNPALLRLDCLVKELQTDQGYQWFYEGKNGWWQYDARTSMEMEERYAAGEQVFELLIAGFLYVMDMKNMIQIRRNDPTRRRRIKRDTANIPDKKGVAGLKVGNNSLLGTPERRQGDGGELETTVVGATASVQTTTESDLDAVSINSAKAAAKADESPPAPSNTPQLPEGGSPIESSTTSDTEDESTLSSVRERHAASQIPRMRRRRHRHRRRHRSSNGHGILDSPSTTSDSDYD